MLILEREVNGGTQELYRFDNNYGASVVRGGTTIFGGTYGAEEGLWELAVIKFKGPGDLEWSLTYDTEITDDVLGSLTREDITNTLEKIENIKA